MWLVFLALHLVGLVGYNLLLRKSLLAKVDRWTLATLMQTAIAIPIVIVCFFVRPDFTSYSQSDVLQILMISLLVIVFHWTNVKALQYLEASTYSILYNLRIIFTTILGIAFLSEAVVPLQIIGGLLIFFGVLAVRQKGEKHLTLTGAKWGIAAGAAVSVLNMSEKRLIGDIGYLKYVVPVMILSAVIMWVIYMFQHKPFPHKLLKNNKTLWYLLPLRALSAYGFTLAFNAGGVLSVSSYISSLSAILIVLLGVWWLGERDYVKHKVVATTLAFAGLTVILVSKLL